MATAKTLGYGLLLLCLASVSCEAQGRIGGQGSRGAIAKIAGPGETVYNVLDFGANPDGKELSTTPFLRAWYEACQSMDNRKRLVIPHGEFLVETLAFQGPCNGTSPIVVEIVGTIKAYTGESEAPNFQYYSFGFEYIDGLVVIGGGTFNGQGEAFWQNLRNPSYRKDDPNRSHFHSTVEFRNVKNAIIRDLTSVNSIESHYNLLGCDNFRAEGLRIITPRNILNTDGIRISNSTNVKVSKSVISTGDDCISIGLGSTNVLINKITCGSGNGISVGSFGYYMEKHDVKGLSVKNCTFKNSGNGLRIKTWLKPDKPPTLFSSFLFQNIIMNSVKNPIIIDQGYCVRSKCVGKPQSVKISDVHFQNIKGTSTSETAVKISCSSQVPCQNVQLSNIGLKYAGASSKTLATSSTCMNADIGYTGLQNPPPCRD